ncbi:hypothetical protein DPV78_010082 [Talaromyces pinophilus]|nr:hypothetical protein DPV78_010082 [Talaromyces pinophilus]
MSPAPIFHQREHSKQELSTKVEIATASLVGGTDLSTGQTVADPLKSSDSTVSQLVGIRLRTPRPQLSKDNMCPFRVRTVCSFFVFDPKVDQVPKIPTPTTPSLENTWFPEMKQQQHADSEGTKKEWADPDVFLKTWKSVMADRSGVPSTNVARMYDQFSNTSPTAVFERAKWNECFPVSPLVSVGSTW